MKTHQERANALVQQANHARENGRLDEAIRAYREAIALVPAYGTFNLHIAEMLLEANRLQEAADAYRQVAYADPELETAWVGLGKCLLVLENHEDALEAFQSALDTHSNNADANYYSAILLGMDGEFKEAANRLLKALNQRPGWEAQARREAALKPVFEHSRRLSAFGQAKKWWEVWK